MDTQPNAVERAYKRLNTVAKLTVSTEEWIMLLAIGLALAVPDLTGIPPKYGSPAILFLEFSIVAVSTRRPGWGKTIFVNAFGCFVLFLVLSIFASKH